MLLWFAGLFNAVRELPHARRNRLTKPVCTCRDWHCDFHFPGDHR